MSSVLVAAGLAAYYALRANTWAVMTDELQVARLATSIAEEFSPVPTIHGTYYAAHGQVYPLLLAPLYGTLTPPAAATAARAERIAARERGDPRLPPGAGRNGIGHGRLRRRRPDRRHAVARAVVDAPDGERRLRRVHVVVLLCQRAIALPGPGRDAAAWGSRSHSPPGLSWSSSRSLFRSH